MTDPVAQYSVFAYLLNKSASTKLSIYIHVFDSSIISISNKAEKYRIQAIKWDIKIIFTNNFTKAYLWEFPICQYIIILNLFIYIYR